MINIPGFRWRVVPPCLLTLTAMLAGVAAIVHALQGSLATAATFVFAAMLLDGVDGAVARLIKGTSAFGMELDSFSDAMALGAAPAIIVYKLTSNIALETGPAWLPNAGAVLCAMIVTAGVCRLGRFRLTSDPHADKGTYQGLAIGGPAGWVAIFTLCHATGVTLPFTTIPIAVNAGPFAVLFWTVLVVLPFLEVSSIAYPKPTKSAGKFALFALCLAFTVAVEQARPYTALVLLVYGVWYALLSPVFRRFQKREPKCCS